MRKPGVLFYVGSCQSSAGASEKSRFRVSVLRIGEWMAPVTASGWVRGDMWPAPGIRVKVAEGMCCASCRPPHPVLKEYKTKFKCLYACIPATGFCVCCHAQWLRLGDKRYMDFIRMYKDD